MASEWNAVRTNRGTLHVMNSKTLEHFEAVDEAEAEATIESIAAYKAAKAAEEAGAQVQPGLTMPVGEPALRSN